MREAQVREHQKAASPAAFFIHTHLHIHLHTKPSLVGLYSKFSINKKRLHQLSATFELSE
jgi:hypothetical protein